MRVFVVGEGEDSRLLLLLPVLGDRVGRGADLRTHGVDTVHVEVARGRAEHVPILGNVRTLMHDGGGLIGRGRQRSSGHQSDDGRKNKGFHEFSPEKGGSGIAKYIIHQCLLL